MFPNMLDMSELELFSVKTFGRTKPLLRQVLVRGASTQGMEPLIWGSS